MHDHVNGTRLLLWDDADVRARLDEVLVAPPVSVEVDADAVFTWLEGRSAPGQDVEAVFFTSVADGTEQERAAAVTELRQLGYEVHVRPARADGTAPAMAPSILARIDQARQAGELAEVVVASHDAAGLRSGLESVAAGGVAVTVLGFRERGGFAASSPSLGFVDLEQVDGAYPASLPRTNLYDLPDEGRALAPLRRRGKRAGTSEARPTPAASAAPSAEAARSAEVSSAAEVSSPVDLSERGEVSEHAEASASPAPVNRGRWFQSPEAGRGDDEAVAVTQESTETSSLDELLSGLRPSLAGQTTPARPGRVAPPNGTPS